MIPTPEEIVTLTYEQSKRALKQLERNYRLDTPIKDLSPEEWLQCDDLANCLIALEDRVREFEDPRVTTLDPKATVIQPPKPKPKEKTGPRRRKFRIGDEIYEDSYAAAKKLGIKIGTMRTYVSRYPDKYGYID